MILIEPILKNPQIRWATPISHMGARDPDFQSWDDSSLTHAGGVSHDLTFWWHLQWPQQIQQKTLKYFSIRVKENDKIISINLLEYAVLITNYAIVSQIVKTISTDLDVQYPILLNWTDNMSALAWTKRAAISTPAGKALTRIFCILCMNNNVSCTADYINTHDNLCADLISRVPEFKNKLDFSLLFQKFPELMSYHRLHLSKDFVSCLMQALLSGLSPALGEVPLPLQSVPEGITL